MKRRVFRFSPIAIVAIFLILIVGCSDNPEIKSQDENIQTIEAVLQNTLTGPDDELKHILEEDFDALGPYEEKLYKDYFADEASYIGFISIYGSTTLLTSETKDYEFEVTKIEYEKTDSKEIIYNFSVELQYQKEGSELSEVGIVDGQANLNEAHKIERILIRAGDFLNGFEK
ncbi:hypothetical protein CWR48_10435 [Oceanobacillus arenosus]|uniref:Uncharacterized protein n=1 Tax=Oceanobacillus arenosus TaxID=1229153 RepID=A0A3D8PRH4_9BACI|nr:hypothetical protein [Oceanobacillus arenosus]RDW18730.1 hypothetical protein CWR48_10435 [Oceanobacillus arenosus]